MVGEDVFSRVRRAIIEHGGPEELALDAAAIRNIAVTHHTTVTAIRQTMTEMTQGRRAALRRVRAAFQKHQTPVIIARLHSAQMRLIETMIPEGETPEDVQLVSPEDIEITLSGDHLTTGAGECQPGEYVLTIRNRNRPDHVEQFSVSRLLALAIAAKIN